MKGDPETAHWRTSLGLKGLICKCTGPGDYLKYGSDQGWKWLGYPGNTEEHRSRLLYPLGKEINGGPRRTGYAFSRQKLLFTLQYVVRDRTEKEQEAKERIEDCYAETRKGCHLGTPVKTE